MTPCCVNLRFPSSLPSHDMGTVCRRWRDNVSLKDRFNVSWATVHRYPTCLAQILHMTTQYLMTSSLSLAVLTRRTRQYVSSLSSSATPHGAVDRFFLVFHRPLVLRGDRGSPRPQADVRRARARAIFLLRRRSSSDIQLRWDGPATTYDSDGFTRYHCVSCRVLVLHCRMPS
ncbi:hypothetical protein BDZ89DRAFT_487671 [Hymenopellis radicata]|nr:hypothetical protein BDZ89DRAFT_487671 [Hymenopellis radicata]